MGEEYSRRLKTNTATERNEEKKQVRKNGEKNEERKKKKTETEVVNKRRWEKKEGQAKLKGLHDRLLLFLLFITVNLRLLPVSDHWLLPLHKPT